ncbi:SusC/RagA family TonB-linked outer membrane protein [Sphingobacterium thalpophilum]|uniref:SusC/RagA family TonB-linked outer membrane protein n=1 Tax=Sphingobacterium thalpophilum TaxID=259 RepID=UPI003C74AE9A
MNKAFRLAALLCAMPIGMALAQQVAMKGRVVDAQGHPLIGATVQVKGSSASPSAVMDNGEFSLNVKKGETILVTMLGYAQRELVYQGQASLEVVLEGTSTSIEEVVVVGYGTQKKVNLTGAVSVIENSQLERRPNLSTSSALQGLAPGVTVTSQTGAPGGDAGQIRIRGINSFGGSDSSPLVIIDGVAGSIDNIDYNLIESISVLKDAASSAIYGSRAANGVILITTKRGKDKLAIHYKGYIGMQDPTAIPKVADGLTYMRMFNEANLNDGNQPTYTDEAIAEYSRLYAENPDNFDWQKAILTGSGFTQNHFLSLSANSGIIRVAPSFGYSTQDGLIKNTGFKRYVFRNNMDITPSEKFTVRMDLSMTNKNREQIAGEGTIWNYLGRMPTDLPIRHPNGLWAEGWVKNNPVAQIEEGGNNKTNNLEFIGNLSLNYKPTEWLSLLGTIAPRYVTRNTHQFNKMVEVFDVNGASAGSANTTTDLTERAYRQYFGSYFVTATADRSYGDHQFKMMLGASRESYNEKFLMGYRRDFMYDTYEVLNAGADNATKDNGSTIDEWLLVSQFGRFNYSFKDRYLFEANIRHDGSSRFVKNNRWSTFPSFSAGWRLSEEPFMGNLKGVVSQLKLRGSWGKLGNQNIGDSYYPFASQLALGSISMGGQLYPLVSQNEMANERLVWESTTMSGAGLDAVLFKDFSLTFDWYSKTTNGILLKLDIPALHGLPGPFQNAGKVQNKGWELAVRYDKKFGDFKLGLGGNIADVKNKILDMRNTTMGTFLRQQTGYPINSIYGYLADGYYNNADEIKNGPAQFGKLQPGDIRYKDIAGEFDAAGNPIPDGKINESDKVIIGNTIPRYTYGINLDLSYKGIRLNAFLQGVAKADGYLSSHYVVPLAMASAVKEWQTDYWTVDNPDAALPRLSHSSTNNTQNSTFWMRSAAYLRLKNVQLGYEIPKHLLAKLRLNGLFVYVNGQNLWTKTNFYKGYDPEINYNAAAGEGVSLGDGNFYPQVKVYTFGVDFKF